MRLRWALTLIATLALHACDGGVPREERPAPAPSDASADVDSPLAAAPAGATARRTTASALVPDFRLRLEPESHLVHVELELDPGAADTIELQFRADWAGYPELESRIGPVEAWSARGARPVSTAGGGTGRFRIPAAGEAVTVSFALRMTPPSETRLYHRVSQLGPQGGHLIGRDMLPLVRLSSQRGHPSLQARLWFTGLPSGWRVATVAARAGNAYALDDIRDAVFAVGPLRTRQFVIGPRAVTVAIVGEWGVSDDRIFGAVESIAGGLHGIARDGWRDGPHLIVAGRVPGGAGLSTGGQVVGRSGMVYVGGRWPDSRGFNHWLPTAAHELMHWYTPTAFRFTEPPPSWFGEGFNEYVALKTLLAGGLWSPERFLAEMGERIARHRSSPHYGKLSMAEAQADFWEENAYRYIYDGGATAAFLLDLGFQVRRASLEHVLRELRGEPIDGRRIVRALSTVRENEWLEDWLANAAVPDWDARLESYGLTWRGDSLAATTSWATDALSSIRP